MILTIELAVNGPRELHVSDVESGISGDGVKRRVLRESISARLRRRAETVQNGATDWKAMEVANTYFPCPA
jgi:hypothetical protein